MERAETYVLPSLLAKANVLGDEVDQVQTGFDLFFGVVPGGRRRRHSALECSDYAKKLVVYAVPDV